MLLGGVVLATATRMIPLRVPGLAALRGRASRPGAGNAARARGAGRTVSAVAGGRAERASGAVPDRLQRGDADTAARRPARRAGRAAPRAADSGLRARPRPPRSTHGALGASISGAGPSAFAWFASQAEAEAAAPAMQAAFAAAGYGSRAYVTPVAGRARSHRCRDPIRHARLGPASHRRRCSSTFSAMAQAWIPLSRE